MILQINFRNIQLTYNCAIHMLLHEDARKTCALRKYNL
jgi:hypothetical protein